MIPYMIWIWYCNPQQNPNLNQVKLLLSEIKWYCNKKETIEGTWKGGLWHRSLNKGNAISEHRWSKILKVNLNVAWNAVTRQSK